jgi:hypothetical protein
VEEAFFNKKDLLPNDDGRIIKKTPEGLTPYLGVGFILYMEVKNEKSDHRAVGRKSAGECGNDPLL